MTADFVRRAPLNEVETHIEDDGPVEGMWRDVIVSGWKIARISGMSSG